MRKPLLPSVWGGNKDLSDPFRSLQKEIDRVFDDFGHGSFWPFADAGGVAARLSPSIDVSETDNAIEVTAELPGVEEKDIDVTLSNGMLTIKGEKRAEKEEKKKDYHLVERSYGSFHRSVALPEGVDTDKVEAHFDNGVLKVSVPKPAEARAASKKIAIKSKG